MLLASECTAAYGSTVVFERLSFRLEAGQTAAIVGPSGCGKSTLLAALAGIKGLRGGTVRLDEEVVAKGDRRVGLILQSYGLFPWMTVDQNVALGLRLRRLPREARAEIVEAELRRLDIESLRNRYPAELSGGQQQRVAIARTFAVGPSLLLMDEPFSALDTLTREHLQDTLVRRLNGDRVTTVIVTHSIEEAAYLGKRILVLRSRDRLDGKSQLVSIENEHLLGPAYRMSPLYSDRCREVRRALEGSNDA